MKLLSWKCRGLGNPTVVRALKKLLKTHYPDVIFLVETKLTESDKGAKYSLSFGLFSNTFMVNCSIGTSNRSGGITLIWNNSVNIKVLNYNNMFIDVYVTACNSTNQWYAAGMYGSPYHNSKHLTCDTINDLHANRTQNSCLFLVILI